MARVPWILTAPPHALPLGPVPRRVGPPRATPASCSSLRGPTPSSATMTVPNSRGFRGKRRPQGDLVSSAAGPLGAAAVPSRPLCTLRLVGGPFLSLPAAPGRPVPLWAGRGSPAGRRTGRPPHRPFPQPHGHPGSHVTSTDTPASCPCVRPRGDLWPVSLGQVRPGAVCAVAVPADPLRGLLRPRHPAAYGEQPPGWGQSRRRGLGAGGSSAWGV